MTAIKEDTESHFAQSSFTVSPGIKTIRAKDVAPIAELSHLKKTTLSLETIIAPNGTHNGQKHVGYDTERSEGSLRVFVPNERSE
jgi:hypothetical protein